jgi:enoyl-[acyl-carrier protein] reductase I
VEKAGFLKSVADVGCTKILGGFSCDVTDPASMEAFFRGALPEILRKQSPASSSLSLSVEQEQEITPLNAVIHSLAFAPNLKTPLLETTRESFLHAHEVSAYSLIQVAKESLPYLQASYQYRCSGDPDITLACPSLTTLSYLGATRAIPGYNVMGPAKASLESVMRGLALELGSFDKMGANKRPIRVNAVRAGSLPTLSSLLDLIE